MESQVNTARDGQAPIIKSPSQIKEYSFPFKSFSEIIDKYTAANDLYLTMVDKLERVIKEKVVNQQKKN